MHISGLISKRPEIFFPVVLNFVGFFKEIYALKPFYFYFLQQLSETQWSKIGNISVGGVYIKLSTQISWFSWTFAIVKNPQAKSRVLGALPPWPPARNVPRRGSPEAPGGRGAGSQTELSWGELT